MDVVSPLIWLSSIAGATLFYSGGRLWGRAVSVEAALAPLLREEREARARAEQEALGAQRARDDAQAEAQRLSQIARRQRLELTQVRAEAEQARQLARAADAEKARAAEALAMLHAAEVEIEGLRLEIGVERTCAEVESGALRRELEELRQRLRGFEALDCSQRARSSAPAARAERPPPGQALETALEGRLDELLRCEEGSRTAVLSDMSGLLVASSGDTAQDDRLAAAVSMTTDTTARLRQILPLGEPLEIRLTDVNRVVLTARWLRSDQGDLLLSTLGVSQGSVDSSADTIGASISDLISAA